MTNPGHTPEIEELLAVHALGALDGEDLRLVEEHLATGCPEWRSQLAQGEGSVEALVESVVPVAPAETTRARLLAKLPPARRRGAPGWGWLAAAAALLLVCGLGWWNARGEVAVLRAERDN